MNQVPTILYCLVQHREVSRTSFEVQILPHFLITENSDTWYTACRYSTEWAYQREKEEHSCQQKDATWSQQLPWPKLHWDDVTSKTGCPVMPPTPVVPIASPLSGHTYHTASQGTNLVASQPKQNTFFIIITQNVSSFWSGSSDKHDSLCSHSQ